MEIGECGMIDCAMTFLVLAGVIAVVGVLVWLAELITEVEND